MERKTNLTLPSFVWVGGEAAKWPNAAEGETFAAFLCLFGMSGAPKRKIFFLRVRYIDEASGEHTGREVWQKVHRGGNIHQVGGYDPPHLCWMPLSNGFGSMRPRGGRPGKQTQGPEVVVVEADAPLPIGVRAPTPPPSPPHKPSNVAKVAAQPPPEALDVEALGASVATHVRDTC